MKSLLCLLFFPFLFFCFFIFFVKTPLFSLFFDERENCSNVLSCIIEIGVFFSRTL